MTDISTNTHQPDLIRQTIECLEKTFTASDKNERIAAEAKLKTLENDILTHVKMIISAVVSANLKEDLKRSVVIYAKNLLNNRIQTNSIERDQLIEILKTLIDVLLDGNLSESLKENINLLLTIVLNSSIFREDTGIIVNICELLRNFIMAKKDQQAFKPVISLFQSIISSKSSNENNIYDIAGKQLETIDHMVTTIRELTGSVTNVEVLLVLYDIVRGIFDYLFLSLLKMKKLQRVDSILKIYVAKFVPFAVEIIQTGTTGNIISFTGIKEVDNTINTMKSKAFQFVSFVVQNEGITIKDEITKEAGFKLIEVTVASLQNLVNERTSYLLQMSNDSQEYPDFSYETIMFQMVLLQSRFLSREPFVEKFSHIVKSFVLGIIFPLCRSTRNEIVKMKVDGDDYHTFIVDLIHGHKLKFYKTALSFLLIKLCEKYDGLATHVINFCYQLIDFNCSEGQDLYQYPLLSTQESLKHLTQEDQLDVSILFLCILSQQVIKIPTLKENLKKLLQVYENKLMLINSELVQDKLCILFGLFTDELYTNENLRNSFESISHQIEFLFVKVFNYKVNPGIAFQAANSLVQLISEQSFQTIASDIVRKFITQVIDQVKEIEVDLFFDLLLEIVLYLDVEDYVVDLSRQLANRILIEIKSTRSKVDSEGGLNVYISKCFNILKTILDKVKMIVNNEEVVQANTLNITIFEEIIAPVVVYLKKPEKISFDDEIVELMTSIITSSKTISHLAYQIFPYLNGYMRKQEFLNEKLFKLLKLYIAYNNGFFNDEANSNFLLDLLKEAIDLNADQDTVPVYPALLGQLWFQIQNLPPKCVESFTLFIIRELQSLYDIYRENLDDLNTSFEVYLITTYLGAIYSGMNHYSKIIIRVIADVNLMTDLINWTHLLTVINFFSVSQSKFVVLGICAIISDEVLQNKFEAVLIKLLSIAFNLLIRQKKEESENLKKQMKKEIECNFVEDEDDLEGEDEDEGGEIEGSKIIQMKKIAKAVAKINKTYSMDDLDEDKKMAQLINNSVSTDYDEYLTFKEAAQRLQPSVLSEFHGLLNDMEKNLLMDLMLTKRIKVEYNNMVVNVPRRTVKLKRTNENN